MTVPQPFAANLLRASADGLAGIIAARLHEEAGEGAQAVGDFASWKRHAQQHLLQLAAALDDGAPQGFVKQVLWSRDAFQARGQCCEPLSTLLRVADEALGDSLPADAHAVVRGYYQQAAEALASDAEPTPSHLDPASPHGALAIRYVAALRGGDEPAAVETVLGALREGELSVHDAVHHVLVPALREFGRAWHMNALSIAEEHFATAVTQKLLARALALNPPAAPNGKSVLLTAVAGDSHGFGIQIIAAEFELDGWRTICLGTNTPPEDLADMANQYDVDLVGIGATLDTQRQAVLACITALRLSRPDQRILVGGQAFDEVDDAWRRCGADGFARSAREAVDIGRKLVGVPA